MEQLFNESAYRCSKQVTTLYSTSFSLGIRCLGESLRPHIYAVYGFVRYADEIVDTFHHLDKERLLKEFSEATYGAINEKFSMNPILHSFQHTVNAFQIDRSLIDAFLKSMAMDLDMTSYTESGYQEYIYGSAEVVGLMCLAIFTNGNREEYERLLPTAKHLGAAFQKVNFLRDMKSDYQERGRVYFPETDFSAFSLADKAKIEADIQHDFDEALKGIKQLPRSSRWGVYLAYIYYISLFEKIKHLPPKAILQARIRIHNTYKFLLLIKTWLQFRLNLI